MRTITMRVVREFVFEVEVEDDHPVVEDADEFERLFGPFNVGDDSMLVSEEVTDDARA